jgi:hypothetical protein
MAIRNKSVRTVQVVRLWMLIAVGAYFLIAVRLPATAHDAPPRMVEIGVVIVSMACVGSVFYFHSKYVLRSEALMRETPGDAQATKRWAKGYIAIYVLSVAVALYGMVLHFLGAPPAHIVPFFIVGAALLFWFKPRPRRDEIGR